MNFMGFVLRHVNLPFIAHALSANYQLSQLLCGNNDSMFSCVKKENSVSRAHAELSFIPEYIQKIKLIVG